MLEDAILANVFWREELFLDELTITRDPDSVEEVESVLEMTIVFASKLIDLSIGTKEKLRA